MSRFITVLLSIAAAACGDGCARSGDDGRWQAGPTTAVRYSVFEVAAGDADAAVAGEGRRGVAGSAYEVAVVPAEVIEKLRRLTLPDSGPLADHTVIVSGWPRGAADGWSYSRADEKVLGSGGGTGFLGVRGTDEAREVRLDYHVTHGVNSAGPIDPAAGIDARIFFTGDVKADQALAFIAPLTRADGTRVAHVIAFGIGEPE